MTNNFFCRFVLLPGFLSGITMLCSAQVSFIKHIVSSRFGSEGVATGDVNQDGRTDILAGNYWYESPAWKRHILHADTLNPVPEY